MAQDAKESIKGWKVSMSSAASRTSNPLRKLVDRLKPPVSEKKLISLSIGDPTVFGNLKTAESITRALTESSLSFKYNGYVHASGIPIARKVVAETHSAPHENLTEDDVIITSGCSGALEIAIVVLANERENILLPAPGFSLYQTICDSKGIEPRYYRLLPEKNWEIDIEHLKTLIDSNTRAILVNNPSNPCGSVYTKEHLQKVLEVAEEFKIPIIADEIYEKMVFEGSEFHSLSSLSETVPILEVGGIAKRYLVPGWRLGWVIVHDRNGAFSDVRTGCHALATLLLGANSLIQSIMPSVLKETPREFYDDTQRTLQEQAFHLAKKLSEIPELHPITPQGAMYMMVRIDCSKFSDIPDDVTFCEKLVKEELVVLLPGTIFKCSLSLGYFFRAVISAPISVLDEAAQRISVFCANHRL
eukprot:TRINITY_DN224_c0_g2_i2.p1 TRINITY_DN224_c0_g2~~TRINITY_DN224_c0_g2_i2.p1  ORF type:complete len:417 (-),score=50.40 TRINITY_DN224_c0_g2_i2:144-1394(-)